MLLQLGVCVGAAGGGFLSDLVYSCGDGFNMRECAEERRTWVLDFLLGDLKLLLWSTSFNRSFRVSPFICNPNWPELGMILGPHCLGAEIIGVSCHTPAKLKAHSTPDQNKQATPKSEILNVDKRS